MKLYNPDFHVPHNASQNSLKYLKQSQNVHNNN